MKTILFLLLCILPFYLFCQTISGKMEDGKGDKIPFANVVTRDSVNAPNIKEFVIARNGEYSITVTRPYQRLVLEVSANSYQKGIFVIDDFNATKNYTHHFSLVKDSIRLLRPVVVTAKKRSFQLKGDTVSYDVSAYSNGTERKIQDVIKNLPGMEVNEKTGEIKYKGKPVETVKLDGVDLFAGNYTIGTKNINVDMVEQVQAIENYSANPLLKGIEGGDKVALNLVLKKTKTDYSGSIDAGTGVLGSHAAIDAAANVLGISKKYKSFATLSYNNIGFNNTPFDYFSYNPTIEQLKEDRYLANKYIPDTYFDNEIDPGRSNINHSLFGSYNAAFNVGEKLNLKTNFYYLSDNINSEQLTVSANNINGQQFTTSDLYSINKKPAQYRGDAEAKYNVSKKSLLEYTVRYKIENINTENKVVLNNAANYNTVLKTKDNYFRQAITYTNRLSDTKAIQLNILQSYNDVPQNYSFLPAIADTSVYTANNQLSRFKKNSLGIHADLLGSTKSAKFVTSTGLDCQNTRFVSDLKGLANSQEQFINGFDNNFKYSFESIYSNFGYKIRLRRFTLGPALTLTYLQQHLAEKKFNHTKDSSNFLTEPSFSVNYKVNNSAALLITAAYRQVPVSEEYFVSNPVYISTREIKSNDVSLHIQQSKTISAFYMVSNLYRQFQLNTGGSYSENRGNFVPALMVQQNATKLLYFFLAENNKILSLNFMVEKYLPFLESTVRFKTDYFLQQYKNIVNNSLLRSNTTQTVTTELFFKTAFDGKINFANTLKHRYTVAKAEDGLQFTNQGISNGFQIIVKPSKRIFFVLSTDYFRPDVKKTGQNYLFIDASLNYQPKSKICDVRFKARNITNNKTLNHFDTNDFSTTNFQTNLLPSLFLLSVSRNL